MRRWCDGVAKSLRVFLISELAVGVLIRWVSLLKVDDDDEAMFREVVSNNAPPTTYQTNFW